MMVLLPVVFLHNSLSPARRLLQQYMYAMMDPLFISGGLHETKIMEESDIKCADTSEMLPGAAL